MKRLASSGATTACVSTLVLVVMSVSHAQDQSTPIAFDVVSIKRAAAGSDGMFMRTAPGSVTTSNVPVVQLIRQAYGLQESQVAGGPEWMAVERFDIEARFDPTPVNGMAGPPRVQAMLKTMLADRFKLAAHLEPREMPILALVLTRDDKRLGPQLRPSAVDCAALAASRRGGPPPDARGALPPDGRRGGGPGLDGRGAPPPGPGPDGRPVCGGRGGFGQMMAGGQTMAQFATQLSQLTRSLVVDRTGLSGGYDLDLTWTPTPDQQPPGRPPGFQPPPIDPNGPSLFAALDEQLGLRLESTRAPVDVLVIDRIERPTEN
jgi:uncharacterized protein (TIGR03435 family)